MTSAPASSSTTDIALQFGTGPHCADATFSDLLRGLYRQAADAWPGVDVSAADFWAFLAERIPVGTDPRDALIKMKNDDLYLACGCAHGNVAAIRTFDEQFMRGLVSAIPRCDTTGPDEILQRVRIKLLAPSESSPPKIVDYSDRGSLRSWVRVVAVREALMNARKLHPDQPTDDDALDELRDTTLDDPELLHLKRRYRAEFKVAFATAFQTLSAKQRNLLRQHLIDNLNIDQVGAMYQVHRATAARWIAEARVKLLKATRKELSRTLRINESEFKSLMQLVRSQLDLSLHRLLTGPPD